MLRNAYADAGIDPAMASFVGAHGTGTLAGDPVELEALSTVLGPGRERRLLVGSHKTNIGHSEAAAGLIGLIKTVLCLRHRTVPGNLHLRNPNPAIPWEDLPVTLPAMATPLDDASLGGTLAICCPPNAPDSCAGCATCSIPASTCCSAQAW